MSLSAEVELTTAFVGSYVPRRCGIATFTCDLAEAVHAAQPNVAPMVLAMTDPGGQYPYPSEVKYEIRQGVKGDYARAAEFVNYSDVRLVSIQHEYGIFGGDDGGYILDFLSALRVPAIATLHTVLKQPSESQRSIVQKLAQGCARLVVMSHVAEDLLASSYGIRGAKVEMIAHGIPTMEPCDREQLKAKFGIPGRRMMLTFGLLSANKGIETVIRALPKVIRDYPDLVYFVVGATHPVVRRRDGEAYRTMVEREAEALGVRDHLVFRDQFVSNEELRRYLQAADVFVSPYLSEAQVTSGALSFAMGAGAAVVSTPYWHAQELLAQGRGCLFPFRDHEALAATLLRLLDSPSELSRVRVAAAAFARDMAWPRVGQRYVELGKKAIQEDAPRRALATPVRPSTLPELRLDHLLRLTDDTGIVQHATHSVPARSTGYCVDDNARALIVALQAERLHSTPQTRRLITTYLSYLYHSQEAASGFANFMNYARVLQPGAASDDCIGRAVWALGATIQLADDQGHRQLAREMLERALAQSSDLGPRGSALVILGLSRWLSAEPKTGVARERLEGLARRLVDRYLAEATEDWRWFEPTLTYDNALIPFALFQAYQLTGDRSSLRVARASLEFLEQICFQQGRLLLVGNRGWLSRGGSKPVADEQAIDATAFVLAFRGAYSATGDHHYLERMRESFAWFLGANRLGVPLYDFSTAGCRDGLGTQEPNQNQGAESTLCFLLALLEMLELAGEGLEHAAASRTENH